MSGDAQQAAAMSEMVTRHVVQIESGAGETSEAASQMTQAALELARLSNELQQEISHLLQQEA